MKLGNLLAVLAQAIGIKKTQIIGPENQLSSRSEPTDPRSGLGFLAEGCGTAWSVNDGILEAGCDDQVCGKRVKTHLDLRNCIMNKDGNMYYTQSGNFMDTCSNDKHRIVHGVVSWWNYWNVCNNDHQDEVMALINIDEGVIFNYYGYLACYNIINENLIQHNWPCKGAHWKPWKSKLEGSENMLAADHNLSHPDSPRPTDGTAAIPAIPMFPLPVGSSALDTSTAAPIPAATP